MVALLLMGGRACSKDGDQDSGPGWDSGLVEDSDTGWMPSDTDTGGDTEPAEDTCPPEDSGGGTTVDCEPCDTGLLECGDLEIEDAYDLEEACPCTSANDLTASGRRWLGALELNCLERVVEWVDLRDNPALEALRFDRLTDVYTQGGGHTNYLWIADNPVLTSVELPSLVGVGDALSVERNGSLRTLELPAFEWATYVTLASNGQLDSIALPSMDNAGDLYVEENAVLASLELPALENIWGYLSIEDNESLAEIEFNALEWVGVDLTIQDNTALQRISMPNLISSGLAFDDPWHESQEVRISDNPALTRIELPELRDVDRVHISDNDALVTLEGLSALETIGSLYIHENNALRSLEGLSALRSAGTLWIVDNDALTNLVGHTSLETVGDLTITDNDALCLTEAVLFAASIEVSGSLTIRDNGAARTDCP